MTATQKTLSTRASSINRALDQLGDKWCLLILQEVFWGINTFNEMLEATGASRGVLSNRLQWLQSVECLKKDRPADNPKRPVYHLTKRSFELYANALMAIKWERQHYSTPVLDNIELIHNQCGHSFWPQIRCNHCLLEIAHEDVFYHPGPGAKQDTRQIKTRRRSSIKINDNCNSSALYRHLTDLLGDRWTANIVALSYHRLRRFEEFRKELPIATNILADRLKHLVDNGIFYRKPYQQAPPRYEYHLTDRGKDLYPYFLTLLQWGNKWCSDNDGDPMLLTHGPCNHHLRADVYCDQCDQILQANHVRVKK